jgi:hypothetical protein
MLNYDKPFKAMRMESELRTAAKGELADPATPRAGKV